VTTIKFRQRQKETKMATKKGVDVQIKPSFWSPKKSENRSLLCWLQGLTILLLIIGILFYVHLLVAREKVCVGVLNVEYANRRIYLSDSEDPSNVIAEIGKNLGKHLSERRSIENGFEYTWEDGPKLVVKDLSDNCTGIFWSRVENDYPLDCFVLAGKHWYGGGEMYKQVWPFEKSVMELAAYYPQDTINAFYQKIPAFGPVLGRYWVNSQGIAIIASQTSPLVVGINTAKQSGQLCLSINPTLYPNTSITPQLNYTVCKGDNVKTIHQSMVKKYFKKITQGPDETMVRYPVWSTWVRYHSEVNQNDVEEFVDQIVANKFPCSQLEIDDKYTTTYGDYDFDPEKFPKPDEMVAKIHNASCRATTWVHPFASVHSKAYAEGKKMGVFVVGGDGKTPGFLKWWNGYAAAVDVTKPTAYDWFLNRLQAFQKKYSIDSFKFDGGSATYLPFQYTLNGTNIPSNYCVQYAKLASDVNSIVEVRVADHSQDLSVFVRFLDRDAAWDTPMGLTSVIPTVLTFGILGYPFILPDMIGGNGDPDKELFIRWMQLTAFLTSMQFSIAPWDFDNETIAIAHNMMTIRATIMPTLLKGVNESIETGAPIIRPLWWVAPDDETALTIDQQFMVLDIYLVAPVVAKNATSHSVYLPKGVWMEEFGNKTNHTMTEGGIVFYNNTKLADVYYFKNITLSH
jgi:hypothetical protein